MQESLERRVRNRAGERCEYCRIPSYISEFTFPVDHIIAKQHGGTTTYANLALSCPHDNFHKGPNIAGLDPETGRLMRLFNPRRQRWNAHFAWNGPMLVGKTPTGRTTPNSARLPRSRGGPSQPRVALNWNGRGAVFRVLFFPTHKRLVTLLLPWGPPTNLRPE